MCAICGTEVATAHQAHEGLNAVREAYRRRHGLISPNEIRSIRERYGAGQKPFSIILGFGESTIANYERGEIPTAANSNLIRLMNDPHSFQSLYFERRKLIGPTQQKRIEARISETANNASTVFDGMSVRETPDEFTGFRVQDSLRVKALLASIVRCSPHPVHKTKLLKLCFLADFEHFRQHTVSLSGWPYARLPHGPVLQNYKHVLDIAEQNGFIRTQDFDDGTTVIELGDRRELKHELALFSEEEQATIHEVLDRWGHMSAGELSQYTHTLPAWERTDPSREISYVLALEGSDGG